MTPAQAKELTDIGANLVTILIPLAAAYWFFFTGSFRQNVQFDCELRIFDVGGGRDYLAELVLIVENKGQREHRIHNLWCEVRQPRRLASGEPVFYLPQRNLISDPMGYFFVPPGVRQTFPVTFEIPRNVQIARAVALFVYRRKRVQLPAKTYVTLDKLNDLGLRPHQIAKLFSVAPTKDPSPAADTI